MEVRKAVAPAKSSAGTSAGISPPSVMDLEMSISPPLSTGTPPSPVIKPPPVFNDDDLESLDFTGIQLAEEKDPVDAAVEEAAIAFANEDEEHAVIVLQESVKLFAGMQGTEVLWLMLFDLYRLTGQRDAFAAIELDYAKRFEKQPPVWKDLAAQVDAAAARGATLFKGDLLEANAVGFAALLQAIEPSNLAAKLLIFDLSKIKSIDSGGAARLLDILQRAKRRKTSIELSGLDALIRLLVPLVKAGDAYQPYWQLLLECYQRQGKAEIFDDLAFEFAVTFEISPPSYEAPPPSNKKLQPLGKVLAKPVDDAFYLDGALRGGGKIDGLDVFLQGRESAVIDMSGVTRIDFPASGVLLTSIQPSCMTGVSVNIRHPNYLVAALLKVVGIADVATVINAKH